MFLLKTLQTMPQLTTAERTFIVSKYFETKSIPEVLRLFEIAFPHRNVPSSSTIWRNVRKYQQHGTSLNRNKGNSGRRRTGRSEANIQAVREQLQNNAQVSARRNGLGLPSATFNRITRLDLRWHPYQISIRHELRDTDYPRRLNFCQWFNQQQRNPRFLANFVIGDEAGFGMNGEVNSHNVRQYAPRGEHPEFHFVRREERAKVTVWMGICGNGSILGPFFFNRNVDGNAYLVMLNENIIPQLTEIFNNQFQNGHFLRLWWAQDGAPAHQLIAVRERLLEVFQRRVIALHLPVEWPPRSPDLTPCDYFLWGYLKDRVYRTPPQNIDDLRNKIQQEAEILRGNPALIRRVLRQMEQRSNLCVVRDGVHVENL